MNKYMTSTTHSLGEAVSAGRDRIDCVGSNLECVTDNEAGFGERIRARREELGGLSRERITAQGGPAAVTIAKIERGETKAPAAGTLAMLDVGLRWMPGSAWALYHDGVEPVPLPTGSEGGAQTILTADPGAPLTASRLVELTDASRRLDALAARYPDNAELQSVRDQVNLVTDRFLRTWLIALLEVTTDRGPGRAPDEPIVGVMLAQYLSAPPAPGLAEEDLTDVLYLRWLIGQVDDVDLDDSQVAAFQLRWASTRRTAPE